MPYQQVAAHYVICCSDTRCDQVLISNSIARCLQDNLHN